MTAFGWIGSADETPPLNALEALSGISGSISLAAWVFLLVPQLIENYKRGSADGISLAFLAVWFTGDLANFSGAVWAGLVPTVIILAVYFCFADTVLIAQCLYYNHINAILARRPIHPAPASSETDDPERPLLRRTTSDSLGLLSSRRRPSTSRPHRRSHASSFRRDSLSGVLETKQTASSIWTRNMMSVVLVCAAGAGGWLLAWKTGAWSPTSVQDKGRSDASLALGPQLLGYLSAFCYLSARIPQIIKNHRDRSCEGLSLLFFILSLFGNATYGAGILFYSTEKEYLILNLPWLLGSLGTIVEDVIIFIQFHIYSKNENDDSAVLE